VAVREYGDKIIFLRQIVPGTSDKSYGIHVGRLAGLPEPVITRAKEILENLEINAIAEAGMPALAVHHEPQVPPAAAVAKTEPYIPDSPSDKIQSEVSENKPDEAYKKEPPIKFPDDVIFQPSLFD